MTITALDFLSRCTKGAIEEATPDGEAPPQQSDLLAYVGGTNIPTDPVVLDLYDGVIIRLEEAMAYAQRTILAYLPRGITRELEIPLVVDIATFELARRNLTEDIMARHKKALETLDQLSKGKLDSKDATEVVTFVGGIGSRYGSSDV